MQTIRELLNKIRWDKKEDPYAFLIGYEDRLGKKIIEIPYPDIVKIDEGFMVLDEDTEIPLHRVRHVKREGEIIWKRQPKPPKEQ
ncbi:MAG: DUF504 domain-containing protein [Nanoarchaeota archaeon]